LPRSRLLIADDHAILVEGVRKLLQSEYDIIGSATDGRELVSFASRLQPDIVLLDIGMPLLNGIEAARQIRQECPVAKIVVLTQLSDKDYVRESFRAGVHGYVLKQSASSELATALSEVLKGRYYVTPAIAAQMIQGPLDPEVNPANLFGTGLTPRQREVLQLVAEGKGAKEIAAIIGISVKTVEFHKSSIMDELGLRTTAELTRYAIQQGIVS
jgi:DNA-binding NarL/FixJ family response regulator